MPATGARPLSWSRSRAAGLTFRRIEDEDMPFLRQVYASTRADELSLVDWPPEQKAAFLDLQFRAQHAHYRLHYADMDWLVVSLHGAPAGRLYLDRRPSGHAIVDISLLHAYRARGLGTALLLDLIDEAAAAGKAVSIHVEKSNPAMRLYRRLGFVREADKGVYDLMRREPGAAPGRVAVGPAPAPSP